MGQTPQSLEEHFAYLSWILTCQRLSSAGFEPGTPAAATTVPVVPFLSTSGLADLTPGGLQQVLWEPPHWAHPSPLGRSPLEAPPFREARSEGTPPCPTQQSCWAQGRSWETASSLASGRHILGLLSQMQMTHSASQTPINRRIRNTLL